MVRHLRKPGHPRRRRLVSYRPPVRSITPRQPPGRSASLPLFLSFHFPPLFPLPPLTFLSVPLRFLFRFLPTFSLLLFCSPFLLFHPSSNTPLHFPPPPSAISPSPTSLSLRVYSTGEAFLLIFLLLFLVWLDVARLVVAPSPLSLSLEARERSENGETGETFSLSKLAATDSPLAGNGETVHHVRLKSVTTLHSLMPGLHDQLHFQRGPANYRYDCFRPRGPPDK